MTRMPERLTQARLPRWSLPAAWPMQGAQPVLADLCLRDGRIDAITPHTGTHADGWNLHGAPVLPGLVEAHTHIDKAFTLPRLGALKPGLLAAIETMIADRQTWTVDDVHARASRCLQWAHQAGVVTHAGRNAAIEILLPVAAVAIGLSILGAVLHFTAH